MRALFPLLLLTPGAWADAPPKVLLIVSGEGRAEAGKIVRPGFEMDELAQAWLTLRANGLQVEIASPQGGAPLADKHNPADDHNAAFQADAEGRAQLAATRRIADVKPGEHAALFVIGGKGAMFDLPKDEALLALIRRHQGLLAAVCHGPAAFVNATTPDGKPLLAGRRVTGFTDEEEKLFGKRWAKEYPFWLETRARELGARWEEAALMMPKLVEDGRLITGQNPFSTNQVAEALVRQLGRTPVARKPFIEEATMRQVERWLAADPHQRDAVRRDLAAQPVKIELVAMLGYYQFEAATDDAARRQALAVMEMAEPQMEHPQFRIGLARAYAQLGQPARARELLQTLLAKGVKDEALRAQAEAQLARLPA